MNFSNSALKISLSKSIKLSKLFTASLRDSSVEIREIGSEDDEIAEPGVLSSDKMSKIWVCLSEGFFVLFGGEEPERSFLSNGIGFFEEPG